MDADLKRYHEAIDSHLQQVKAQLELFEARAREKSAEAEIEAIKTLRATKQQLEAKQKELQAAVGPTAEKIKAEIDAGVVSLKGSVDRLAAKLKGHS